MDWLMWLARVGGVGVGSRGRAEQLRHDLLGCFNLRLSR